MRPPAANGDNLYFGARLWFADGITSVSHLAFSRTEIIPDVIRTEWLPGMSPISCSHGAKRRQLQQRRALVPLLRPLLPQQAHRVAVSCTNVLMIVDTFGNVKRIESLIQQLDVGEA